MSKFGCSKKKKLPFQTLKDKTIFKI